MNTNKSTNNGSSDVSNCTLKDLETTVRNITDLEKRFDTLMKWLQHNKKSTTIFENLFQKLVLSVASLELIKKILQDGEKLVEDSIECYRALLLRYHELLNEKNISTMQFTIINIGGKDTGNQVREVFNLFNQTLKPKTSYSNLPEALYWHCAMTLSDFVYCVGGISADGNSTSKVWKKNMNNLAAEWEEVAPLEVNRSKLGGTVHQNHLVVVGGSGIDISNESLESGELYQAALNKWKEIPNMNEGRKCHALVSCCNYLYALGGLNCNKHLSSVERISDLNNPQNNKWEQVKEMNATRHDFVAVSCKGSIYAIGGTGIDKEPLKSAEKYDPETEDWVNVKDMEFERSGHSACVLLDRIFVVGGITKSKKLVSAIECYDPSKDEWSTVTTDQNLKREWWYHASVAI